MTRSDADDAILRTRAGATCGSWANYGTLSVFPGRIEFALTGYQRRLGPPVIHAQGPLLLKHPRLNPWFLRYALIAFGEEALISIHLTPGRARRVLPALRQAGVDYREERTWIDIGYTIARGTVT